MSNTQTRTPAQAMAVPSRGEIKANGSEERELRYVPFASDTEIKLTVAIVTNLICIPTRSGARCSPQEAIKFMMMCQARKLNPFEGDAFLQGYDTQKGPVFNLITAHQAFLKRAEVNKEYDGMESGVMVLNNAGDIEELQGDYVPKGKTLAGGWARVHLKNRKIPMYRRLDLAVFNKSHGRWENDPAGMIVKCAEADALRSAFPTMLGNLYLEQELNPQEKNITPTPKIETPSFITSVPAPAPLPAPAEPEPEPEHAQPAPERQTATEVTLVDVTAHLDTNKHPMAVIEFIRELMKRDGVGDDQVTAHVRASNMAKQSQAWPEMSDSKLRTLANQWPNELEAIRKIQV